MHNQSSESKNALDPIGDRVQENKVQPAVIISASLSDTLTICSPNKPTSPGETSLEQLVHDLRQPLCAIENHAYVLQLSAADVGVSSHLEAIQDLIAQAHFLLERIENAAQAISSR